MLKILMAMLVSVAAGEGMVGAPIPAGSGGSDAFGGRYAMAMRVVSAAHIPLLGNLESATLTYGLLDIGQTGDGWSQVHHVCAVEMEERSRAMRSELPEAFVRTLGTRLLAPQISLVEGSYELDLGLISVGYEPDLSVAVPTRSDDPAVFDWDSDGHPGATVRVRIPLFPQAEIYLAQAGHVVLSGSFSDPERVSGEARVVRLEQRVLGASNPLFSVSPSIHAVPGASTFLLLRVPQETDCAEVPAIMHSAS